MAQAQADRMPSAMPPMLEQSMGDADQAQPLADGAAPPEEGTDAYAIVLGRLARLESANVSDRLAKLESDVSARLAALEFAIAELRRERRAVDVDAAVDAGSSQPGKNGDARLEEVALFRDDEPRFSTDGSPPTTLYQQEVEAPPPEKVDEEVIEVADCNPDDKFDVWAVPDSYVFEDSVWDATILLFCRNSNGQSIMFKWDEVTLIFAFIMNLMFQGMFVAIVGFDMLPNRDFTDSSVSDFLAWRAEFGHQLDETSGMSMVELLCKKSQALWSFQKAQVLTWQLYTGHRDAGIGEPYLIPGNILSLMSLLLWTMTCIKEYRAVVEQALGVWMVPLPAKCSPWSLQFGRAYFVKEDGQISGELISMGYPAKIAVYIFMTFPRLLLLLLLMIYGMQFVAETSSLVDLVLNAIALAFVLDVDEYLSSIVLTKHVRDCCTEMKPLPCTSYSKRNGIWAGCTKKFLFKFLVWAALFLFGSLHYLAPYYRVAQSTLDALCQGDVEFIVQRADDAHPTAIVVDMADAIRPDYSPGGGDSKYYVTCEADMKNEYFMTAYPSQETVLTAPASETAQERKDRMKALTLDYAFQPDAPLLTKLKEEIEGAQFGQWGPQREDYKVRDPGWSAANIEECPRFENYYHKGWRACTPMPELSDYLNCTWTRAADLCDGVPPGDVYRSACDLSTPSARELSCSVWASFNTPHPYLNCDKVVNGTDLELDGSVTLDVADPDYFAQALQTNATVLDAFTTVFEATVASLPAAVAAPDAEWLNLSGKIRFAVDAISLRPQPTYGKRRLQKDTGGKDTTKDPSKDTSTDDSKNSSTGTDATGAVHLVLPFSILQAPETLTTDYISQANWTDFARELTIAMAFLDPQLLVKEYVGHTSDVSLAYCSSYDSCGINFMYLRPNASDIPGATHEVCCYLACKSMKLLVPTQLESWCSLIEDSPSEILRSEAALLAAEAYPPSLKVVQDVCCEEQLTCDLIDGNQCGAYLTYSSSTLIMDPESHYQGPQTTNVYDQLHACCSITCYDLATGSTPPQPFLCDAQRGLALVPDAKTKNPTIIWDKTTAGSYYPPHDFEEVCCEATTAVTCEDWETSTNACASSNKLVVDYGDIVYGEHADICCVESCAGQTMISCPSGYVQLPPEDMATTRFYGDSTACCSKAQGSTQGSPSQGSPTQEPTQGPTQGSTQGATCGDYRKTGCPESEREGIPPGYDDTRVAMDWVAECCVRHCRGEYLESTDIGMGLCDHPTVLVDDPENVYPQDPITKYCCTDTTPPPTEMTPAPTSKPAPSPTAKPPWGGGSK